MPNEENKQRYCLEIGVDKPGVGRVCALEAGPFDRMLDAKRYAERIRGMSAAEVLDDPSVPAEAYDLPEFEIREQLYTVAGVTLNVFTDADGTIDNIDVY